MEQEKELRNKELKMNRVGSKLSAQAKRMLCFIDMEYRNSIIIEVTITCNQTVYSTNFTKIFRSRLNGSYQHDIFQVLLCLLCGIQIGKIQYDSYHVVGIVSILHPLVLDVLLFFWFYCFYFLLFLFFIVFISLYFYFF